MKFLKNFQHNNSKPSLAIHIKRPYTIIKQNLCLWYWLVQHPQSISMVYHINKMKDNLVRERDAIQDLEKGTWIRQERSRGADISGYDKGASHRENGGVARDWKSRGRVTQPLGFPFTMHCHGEGTSSSSGMAPWPWPPHSIGGSQWSRRSSMTQLVLLL